MFRFSSERNPKPALAKSGRTFDRAFDALFRFFRVSTEREKLWLIVAMAFALGYAESLAVLSFAYHAWFLDAQGRPLVRDFLAFWAAGRQALNGAAHAAYDPRLQHAAEAAAAGQGFKAGLGWSYPPLFLFVAAALALMPYAVAFPLWCVATLTFQAFVVASICRRRSAFVYALVAPWGLMTLWVGQNGFLVAGVVGLVLLCLESRPLLAGLLLGALSFKPQFGVLFPLAVAAGGYWRVFGWAALGVVLWNGLAAAFFGFDTFAAFLHALLLTSQTHLNGGVAFRKLQSLYGLVRALGGTYALATAAQICASLAVAAGVVAAWRARVSFSLKAALLAAGLALATPYVFAYDLPVLTIALAFLRRERAFDRTELALVAATLPLACLYLLVPLPSALGASLAVAGMALRRWSLSLGDDYLPAPAR